jgi:hypothetical protein
VEYDSPVRDVAAPVGEPPAGDFRLYNPEGPRIRAWLNDEGTYDLEAPVGANA